jgi:recombination protein RecT
MAASTDQLRAQAAAARTATNGNGTPGKALTPVGNLINEITKLSDQFGAALPAKLGLDPARFVRIATTTLRANEDLALCEPLTVLGALMNTAQLGLEPGGPLGQAYLVPFNDRDRGGKVCTLVIGYKGYVSLAHRTGTVLDVTAHSVHQKEWETGKFQVRQGTDGDHLEHEPIVFDDAGPIIGTYAVVRYVGGGHNHFVMSRAKTEAIRQAAPSKNSPAWRNHWEQMAWAKNIKQLVRFMPLTSELLGRAAAIDESVRDDLSEDGLDKSKVIEVDQDGHVVREGSDDRPEPAP